MSVESKDTLGNVWMDFSGKTIVVSGCGIGFGRAIAEHFVALGGNVHGCDLSREAVASVARSGVRAEVVDLTDRAAAAAWMERVQAQSGGPVDILVNNAGGVAGYAGKPLETVMDTEWDRIFAINVDSAFVLSRAAVAGMKQARAGRIINISSAAGLRPSLTGVQAYCASKHALVGLTRQLCSELGPWGITVNSVAPGFVQTNDATRRQWEKFGAERQAAIQNGIALRRFACVDDIAKAVLFFASDLAGFVTGQILSVDGGQ